MKSLYVYYRVEEAQANALQAAIVQMQLTLRQAMPGLAAMLHQRVLAEGSPMTWMETYQFNGHANAQAWQMLSDYLDAQVALLPAGIAGERHLEWFERITPRV